MSTLKTDIIIDSYTLWDKIGPILAPIFGDSKYIKILHGGDTDIALLISDLNVPLVNVFDTSQAFR